MEDPERQLGDGGGGLGPFRDEDESARPGHALPPPLPPARPGGHRGEAARRGQARQGHRGQPAVRAGRGQLRAARRQQAARRRP